MISYQKPAHDSGLEWFPTNVQVMVIVLWISTVVAAVFLMAEFILKYEHVRILHSAVTRSLAQHSGSIVMAFWRDVIIATKQHAVRSCAPGCWHLMMWDKRRL